MKTYTAAAVLFILLLGINNYYAQQLSDTIVVNFEPVDCTINLKVSDYGTDQVLIVLDIDNTILTSDTDLGSDIWYRWQSGELETKPDSDQILSKDCLYNEAIALLYKLNTMSLTDSLLPDYINAWQNKGITVIALTSRSPNCRAATERELERNGIDLSKTELKTIEGNRLNLDYSFNNREMSYSNGIFMVSGMNKGDMLEHIIGRTGNSFKSIVFVDDTRKNIDAVKNKYSSHVNVDAVLFYYTKIISDRLKTNNNIVLTEEQADKMNSDWNKLIETLNTIFPGRINKSDCIPQVN